MFIEETKASVEVEEKTKKLINSSLFHEIKSPGNN